MRTEKPWGYEEVYPVGKVLFVKKECRISLQYHKVKWERMYLWKGLVRITINEEVKIWLPGTELIEITSGTVHRVEALEDSYILELSTAELNDIVRLADDYGRAEC